MPSFDRHPARARPLRSYAGSEVFNLIAGGTLFRLSVDLQTGGLLRVAKLVDDAEAGICEFLHITFDAPLDGQLFEPLT